MLLPLLWVHARQRVCAAAWHDTCCAVLLIAWRAQAEGGAHEASSTQLEASRLAERVAQLEQRGARLQQDLHAAREQAAAAARDAEAQAARAAAAEAAAAAAAAGASGRRPAANRPQAEEQLGRLQAQLKVRHPRLAAFVALGQADRKAHRSGGFGAASGSRYVGKRACERGCGGSVAA